MGTLRGFPTPPALWLRRAKPAFAYAIMGTLRGFATPFGPPPATSSPLASPFGDFGTCTFPTTPARYARALALGLAKPSGALAPGLAAAAAAANPWAKPAFAYAIMGTGPHTRHLVPARFAGGLPTRLASLGEFRLLSLGVVRQRSYPDM
jgi:hypothetical protein